MPFWVTQRPGKLTNHLVSCSAAEQSRAQARDRMASAASERRPNPKAFNFHFAASSSVSLGFPARKLDNSHLQTCWQAKGITHVNQKQFANINNFQCQERSRREEAWKAEVNTAGLESPSPRRVLPLPFPAPVGGGGQIGINKAGNSYPLSTWCFCCPQEGLCSLKSSSSTTSFFMSSFLKPRHL